MRFQTPRFRTICGNLSESKKKIWCLKFDLTDERMSTSDKQQPVLSISSCQRNLMKTYHNEANTSGITKIASKIFLEFFEQSS